MTDQTTGETVQRRDPIEVTINGKAQPVAGGSTIGEFLAGKGYRVTMIIVELNGRIVPRDAYADIVMRPGDQIEMVHAVGGG